MKAIIDCSKGLSPRGIRHVGGFKACRETAFLTEGMSAPTCDTGLGETLIELNNFKIRIGAGTSKFTFKILISKAV